MVRRKPVPRLTRLPIAITALLAAALASADLLRRRRVASSAGLFSGSAEMKVAPSSGGSGAARRWRWRCGRDRRSSPASQGAPSRTLRPQSLSAVRRIVDPVRPYRAPGAAGRAPRPIGWRSHVRSLRTPRARRCHRTRRRSGDTRPRPTGASSPPPSATPWPNSSGSPRSPTSWAAASRRPATSCTWSAVRCATPCSAASATTSTSAPTPTPTQTLRLLKGWAEAIWETGREFGTIGAQRDGLRLEITTFRAESYDQVSRNPVVRVRHEPRSTTCERRDFTVNAMAVSLPDHRFTDPYGGLDDLAARVIRTPGTPAGVVRRRPAADAAGGPVRRAAALRRRTPRCARR